MKAFIERVEKWVAAFFAVDNSVNEDTVVGVFWGMCTFGFMIARIVGAPVDMNMIYATLSASLLAFGIGGFKKPE